VSEQCTMQHISTGLNNLIMQDRGSVFVSREKIQLLVYFDDLIASSTLELL